MNKEYYDECRNDGDSTCYMFHGFIKTVIRYKALNAIRSYMLLRKREVFVTDDLYVMAGCNEGVPYIEKIGVDLFVTMFYVENEELAKALVTLPKRQKQVIGYIYVLNLSPAEAARMMRISVHGIYTHKGRALSALRKEMIGDAEYG